MMRFRVVAASVAVTVVSLLLPGAATAETVNRWPASGNLELEGRGYGHGRGMSQWGAQGAALQGLTYRQILAFYYPGTSLTSGAPSSLRVAVTADSDSVVEVVHEPGLRATFSGGGVTFPDSLGGAAVSRWRALRSSDGVRLQGLSGGLWRDLAVPGRSHVGTWATFRPADGLLRLVVGSVQKEYRGTVSAVAVGASPGLRSVVNSTMDAYLRSVVPAESFPSWDADALRAQAVAARTYATYEQQHQSATWYDTCDTTQCQVFAGRATYSSTGALQTVHEAASTDAAVADTSGELVTYAGAAAFTQFSATNGGWSVAGAVPYLRAAPDPYDGASPSAPGLWTATVTGDRIAAMFPGVGRPQSFTLTRDGNGVWGGRVTQVRVTGTEGTHAISGDAFRSAAGLRSTWFHVTNAAPSAAPDRDLSGDGLPDAVTRRPDGTLWLNAGRGAGAFTSAVQIGYGWSALTALLMAGDLNEDGHADAVGRRSDGTLWLLPGNGRGWFSSPAQIGHGWSGFRLMEAPGDFDGDGHVDLMGSTSDGNLYLYPGNGRGWFDPPRRVGVGWTVMDELLGPGDFSGDGFVDLLARRTDGTLWLYRGTGSGSFKGSSQVGVGWHELDLVFSVGDANGDGASDVHGTTADGSLRFYPGTGTGAFGRSSVVGSGWGPFDMVG